MHCSCPPLNYQSNLPASLRRQLWQSQHYRSWSITSKFHSSNHQPISDLGTGESYTEGCCFDRLVLHALYPSWMILDVQTGSMDPLKSKHHCHLGVVRLMVLTWPFVPQMNTSKELRALELMLQSSEPDFPVYLGDKSFAKTNTHQPSIFNHLCLSGTAHVDSSKQSSKVHITGYLSLFTTKAQPFFLTKVFRGFLKGDATVSTLLAGTQ